jgi:hypothetical protein
MEALPQDLADFLVTKNYDPEYFDKKGDPTSADKAVTIKFDYVSSAGKNYGTAVCIIADNELSFFFSDSIGRGMEPEDKEEYYKFLEQLSNQATSHGATWSPTNISQLKHSLAGQAAIKEGLFEGYYGNRRVSYMGEQTEARLVIRHNRTLGEADKRYRYVESLFIETADQERFRLPFRSLTGGRAMLEHVRSGGRPYDIRGNHISEIVNEMAVLSRFHRAQQHRIYEGVTQELVESAVTYYRGLQETLRHLGSTRGYQTYFESWAPDQVGEAESLVENLRNMFVEQSVDARIEAALPTLAKIQQQGIKMKEAEIFESWINNLSEGTWALPETPEQQEKLNQLMSAELIVGPEAINATELLNDIVGDKELFDILEDLADNDPRANIWDDSDVQRRLAELGVQTPQSTAAEPADVDQDEAPPVKEQGMAEGDNTATFVEDRELAEMLKYAGVPIKEGVLTDSTGSTLEHIKDTFKRDVKDFTTTGEMSRHLEQVLYDYYYDDMPYGAKTGEDIDTSEWISDRFAEDLGIDEGVLGTVGGAALGSMVGGPIGAAVGATGGQEMTKGGSGIVEGSCNMTAEGEYCPEHGLMECGSMEEDGGAVGMPYSMGEAQKPHPKELEMDALVRSMQIQQRADDAEKRLAQRAAEPHTLGQKVKKDIGDPLSKLFKGDVKGALSEIDDPINSNSAMTGSYYEGKETHTQEGDALLARIKSLALLR